MIISSIQYENYVKFKQFLNYFTKISSNLKHFRNFFVFGPWLEQLANYSKRALNKKKNIVVESQDRNVWVFCSYSFRWFLIERSWCLTPRGIATSSLTIAKTVKTTNIIFRSHNSNIIKACRYCNCKDRCRQVIRVCPVPTTGCDSVMHNH